MLPIRDLNPRERHAVVTWTLIAINLGVWIFAWLLGPGGAQALVVLLGVTPSRLITMTDTWALWTPLTSMFMHGGWAHVLGNVWFLHIFGDNVEDHLGHLRYALLYVLAGLCAVAAQVVLSPFSTIPMVGASGAIAGVLGAYMLRFPRAPILAWFLIGIVELPAFVFLFVWFGYQLVMTVGSLGSLESGGVAFAAHAGGFVAGMLLDRLLGPSKEELARQKMERRVRLAEMRRRGPTHRQWMDPD